MGRFGSFRPAARPANGIADRLDRLLLADDALAQVLFHVKQLLGFGLQHAAHRNARPRADDDGDVACIDDLVEVHLDPPQLGLLRCIRPRGARARPCTGRHFRSRAPPRPFPRCVCSSVELRLHLLERGRHRIHGDAQLGRRFVHQVDGLVGQAAVGHIAMAQLDGLHQRFVVILHLVMILVATAQPTQDGDAVLDVGLVDIDRRKAAFERRILLDVLAILVERRGADALQLAARQRRLEHVGGIHRAGGVACAHHGVQLVDEEDDLAFAALDLLDTRLEPLFELAAEAGAGHHGAQVERDDLLAQQRVGHVVGDDLLRQPFDDGRLADAGFADQHRVVLGAA